MKTFRVDIFIGHRIVSWPFGRLDVSEQELTVRARPAWMLGPRTAQRDRVTSVQIRRRHFVNAITINDRDRTFANVQVSARAGGFCKLEDQLKSCEYPITDRS